MKYSRFRFKKNIFIFLGLIILPFFASAESNMICVKVDEKNVLYKVTSAGEKVKIDNIDEKDLNGTITYKSSYYRNIGNNKF